MKKIFRKIIAGLTIILLVGCGSAALAAGEAEPVVGVQLDGKMLTFTDAVPQVKDQRTFLPFRAVFEAMDAEVGYEGNVITAKRGEKTLTMTIGSTDAKVVEKGVETPIVMDVAPYVDSATWRTYVPVRFAAQAFGCAVGWDQANYTAIIVDAEKLLADIKAERTFTYLEKYLEYNEQYQSGIWDVDTSFDMSMQLMGMPILMDGTMKGTMEGQEKMNADMTITMDMRPFLEAANAQAEAAGQPATPMTEEELALLETLATEGIGMEARADLSKGLMYFAMKSSLLEEAGMPKDSWIEMDMNALLEGSGMEFGELMAAAKEVDYEALIKLVLQSIPLTDSTVDYAQLKLMTEKVADILCDASFKKNGSVAVNTFTYAESDAEVTITLTLNMKNDKVVGFDLYMGLTAAVDEATSLTMVLAEAMDEKGNMTAEVIVDLAGLLGMEMNMEGSYTEGTTSPVTTPPSGAIVIPFEQLLETPAA